MANETKTSKHDPNDACQFYSAGYKTPCAVFRWAHHAADRQGKLRESHAFTEKDGTVHPLTDEEMKARGWL